MNDQKLSSFIMSLISAVLLLFILLGLLAAFYHPETDLRGIRNLYNGELADFKPEPQERALFIAGLVLLPFTLYCSFISFSRFFKKNERYAGIIAGIVYPCLVAALILFAWFLFRMNYYYYFIGTIGVPVHAIAGTILAGAGLMLFIAADRSRPSLRPYAGLLDGSTGGLALAAGLMASLSCVFGLESIKNSFNYLSHFNAVFHSVVQVYLGKQLLVDLINQYGLFPHFIDPVFKALGLSVIKFTVLMALLMAVAYLSIYLFIRHNTKYRTIGNLGFVALVYAGYLRGSGDPGTDNYFQYYPIRFLFPALAIYFVYRYLQCESRRRYLGVFLISSVAVLWNFDTGFAVFLSWLLLLIFRELRGFKVINMLRHLLAAVTSFLAVAASYAGLQFIVYGHLPDFASFLVYQKLFYISGFFMLPMPLWHPWNLVALVYAAGLLCALAALAENGVNARSNCFFYLSILGFGLLSYYQGRSHDECLAGPSYPAVILITLYADTLAGRVKQNGHLGDRVLLLFLLSPLIYCSASLIKEAPGIAANISGRIGAAHKGTSTYLKRNVQYVKTNTSRGEKVLFLTGHSGIFSLATGIPSPVKVAGPSEMLLVSDCDKVADYLASGARKVFVDKSFLEEYSNKSNGCRKITKVLDGKYSINYINPYVLPGEEDVLPVFMMLPRD